MYCKRSTCDLIKGYRVRGERHVRVLLLVRSGLNVIRMCRIMCLRIVVIWLI